MKQRRTLEASLTLEAAAVVSILLLSIGVLIRQAGVIHDETVGAMTVHEAVEKSRHERREPAERTAEFFRRQGGIRLQHADWSLSLKEAGTKRTGTAKGGDWHKEIEMKEFRPETFLRQITLIESPGGRDED